LPPVLDSPLYQYPSELQGLTEAARKKDQEKKAAAKGQQFKAQGHQLYRKFDKSVIFTKVQKQDGEAQAEFRMELDRLGKGTFSMANYQRWQCCSLDALPEEEKNAFYKDGILACALKKDMVAHNLNKVCDLKQPITLIKASNNPKAEGSRESVDAQSGLPKNIAICKGAKLRLTSNLWTAIGWTNGAKGVVHSIIYAEGSNPPELPVAVIGTFQHYTGPRWKGMEKEVPIGLVSRKFFSGGKDSTQRMLPMLLGYALSVHKLQGNTVDKVILNPGKMEFALGLLLVGATRCHIYSPMQKYLFAFLKKLN
jgi:ATP-dependent DNA helicase PIF1